MRSSADRSLMFSRGVISLVLIFLCAVKAREITTMGSGGDKCGDPQRRCLKSSAYCEADKCVCQDNEEGDGNFACYADDELSIEVKNDPMVKTGTNEEYNLPVSCRYLLTHFKTVFKGYTGGTCEVKIHAFNTKRKGTFFVHGLDIALRIGTPISAPPTGDVSYRVYGTAAEGVYTFKELGALDFSPDGPWPRHQLTSIYMPKTSVLPRYDVFNNMFKLEVENCGFQVNFRPSDVTLGGKQTQVPGVSVIVSQKPEWLSQTTVMGLHPEGITVSGVAEELGLLESPAMLLRMFMAAVAQNQPDAASECPAIPAAVKSCTNSTLRAHAMSGCYFMLKEPRFVRCIDKSNNGNTILGLFVKCLQALCGGTPDQLAAVQQQVGTCKASNLPSVTEFLAMTAN